MKQLREEDRIVAIHYRDIELLLEREEAMIEKLLLLLEKNGGEQYISDNYISMTEKEFIMTFVLTPTKT